MPLICLSDHKSCSPSFSQSNLAGNVLRESADLLAPIPGFPTPSLVTAATAITLAKRQGINDNVFIFFISFLTAVTILTVFLFIFRPTWKKSHLCCCFVSHEDTSTTREGEPRNRPRTEYPSTLGLQSQSQPTTVPGGMSHASNNNHSNRSTSNNHASLSSVSTTSILSTLQNLSGARNTPSADSVIDMSSLSSISTLSDSDTDDEGGIESIAARQREEQRRHMVDTLGFDPDFDPDEYVPNYNRDDCIDRERFDRVSPRRRYVDIKHSVLTDDIENYECSICMTELVDTDHVRLLKCKHAFHSRCIDPWVFQANSACPLCRTSLL